MTDREKIIALLEKEQNETVLKLALVYATYYAKYGVDVTQKWMTATEQTELLKRAESYGFMKGAVEIRDSNVRCKNCKWYIGGI